MWVETLGKKGERLGLDEIDLRDIDLTKFEIYQSYITECIFDGMNLNNKKMYSSCLCSSSFKSGNLEHADFYKSDVSYVDFTSAYAKGSRFAKSECVDTIFVQADLTESILVNSLFNEADFRGAKLKDIDISFSSFKGVLLKGTDLTGIKGIEEAFIESINLGTLENAVILEGEEGKKWLIDSSRTD